MKANYNNYKAAINEKVLSFNEVSEIESIETTNFDTAVTFYSETMFLTYKSYANIIQVLATVENGKDVLRVVLQIENKNLDLFLSNN